jgi:hypothetical protein
MTNEEELHELRVRYQQLNKEYQQVLSTATGLLGYQITEVPDSLKTNPVILGIQDLLQVCRTLSFEHHFGDYNPQNSNWSEDNKIIF